MQVEAQIAEAKAKKTKKAMHECMRSCGIYKLSYVLHPKVIPYASGIQISPQDGMHTLFSSGIVNSEAAQVLYMLMKKGHFTFPQFTARFDSYVDWQAGKKPPAVHPSVCSGREGGKPKHDAHLRYSGSQTLHFAQVISCESSRVIKYMQWSSHRNDSSQLITM